MVADAGMISEANQKAIEAAGLSFILGMKIPDVPYAGRQVAAGAPGRGHPGRARLHPALACRALSFASAGTRSSITATRPTGRGGRCAGSISRSPRRPRPSRAWPRSSRTGSSPSTAGTKSVNRELEAKARTLAGLKGYVTNLAACPDGAPVTAEFVIGSYHRSSRSRRASACRSQTCRLGELPPQHDSIEAHLTIVFAALAVSRWIEAQPAGRSGNSSRQPAATAP